MNSQRSQGQAVSPASSGLSYPDYPIASRSGAGTYLIATYGAGAKARPSTRWGWTIKSAKTCLALRSGWYGCYQHRRDRMRLSSPSNVIRSLVTGGGTVLPLPPGSLIGSSFPRAGRTVALGRRNSREVRRYQVATACNRTTQPACRARKLLASREARSPVPIGVGPSGRGRLLLRTSGNSSTRHFGE
jgi:hypothetical protein